VAMLAALPVWLGFSVLYDAPMHPAWILASPFLFLMLVVIRPVLEEMVFRGLLQSWLLESSWGQNKKYGISVANGLTSLVFAGLHVLGHPPWMAASVLLPSLVFGYFRERYQGWLIPAIGLHCFYNAGYFATIPLAP